MCKTDNSKTGVYACVEKEVADVMPMVALRFITNENEELVPTHLVVNNLSYEITNTTLRDGIDTVCAAAQEAVETASASIMAMQQAHVKAASLLRQAYSEYDEELDWADNFENFMTKLHA